MGGIWIETKERERIDLAAGIQKIFSASIYVKVEHGSFYEEYATEANRDRAWEMLENAIASGVRLFRFPTDAELEKGEDE